MKIIADSAIPFLEGRLPGDVYLHLLPGNLIDADAVKDADALVVRTRTRCDAALLEGSKVKLVATATIGTDHIDKEWCEKNGVIVRNAPGCNAPGVAQYVLASLLQRGFDPHSHTLGIVGYGHVGSIVTDWAKQLGIKVIVNDPPRQEAGFNDVAYRGLAEVLAESDAVTLHVPHTSSGLFPTRGLIGDREFQMMKKGALLVNSSRGGIVDENAWKKYIRSGKVRAVVDVWENEPYIDLELLGMAEIATPHIAGYSFEGKKRATRMALESLEEVMGIPVNLIGLECKADPDAKISCSLIEMSYDPSIDTAALKSEPQNFEKLRNRYNYRHEPFFNE